MNHGYTFQSTLAASDSIHWRIEDIIGNGKRLDFSKPFMPESLARTQSLSFLDADEKKLLNQIRGNTYLSIFGLVEEFILPFVLDQARPHLSGDDYRVRALLQTSSVTALAQTRACVWGEKRYRPINDEHVIKRYPPRNGRNRSCVLDSFLLGLCAILLGNRSQ